MNAMRPVGSSSEMINELLPKILQTIPYMVFWKDRCSRYLGCNEVFALSAGLDSPEHIVGLTDFDLPWAREEAESYRADDREVMESGKAKLHIIESQLNLTGERHWLDTSKVPLRNSDGNVIGVLGIYANITEQRVAQEQLRTTRQYLEDAIESIDAGLVMFDAQERLIFCNQRYKELYGLTDALLIPGRSYEDILRDWISLPDVDGTISASAGADNWIQERLQSHRHPSAPFEQCFHDKVILISDRSTRDGGIVSLRTDITPLKRIQLDLKNAKEAAEQASHAKTGFLANMSHEIRTPMAAILGFTDVLLEGRCTTEQLTMLQTIKRNGEHLLALINDILDLSKIEAGKFEIACESVDILTICRDVVDTLSWKAREKGIALDLTLKHPSPKFVLGDALRIRQIVMNLLGNAIKFTEHGSVTLSLDSQHEGGDGEVILEVRDTGIGMSAAECDNVFQPFQQADASTTRRFGGTGLGLTISRRLVELQGGSLALTSQLGVGSVFTCRLPLDPTHASQKADRPLNQQGQTTLNTRLDGFDILLAEDGPDNQRLISHVLRKAGATVHLANNGQEAIDMIAERSRDGNLFDLVLMDMQMPVRDGYSATREISERWPQLNVAAITAHAMSTDREACMNAGCREYLSKPIDRAALLRTCAILGRPAATERLLACSSSPCMDSAAL